MQKYIDSNEARRLSRLNNIKSSIGSKMQHNGYLKIQTERRRKEQLRARKMEAKNRKHIGNGIHVDTSISKADAVSKCGLKLKVTQESTARTARQVSSRVHQEKKKVEVKQPSIRRRFVPKKKQVVHVEEEASLPLLKDRLKVSDVGNNNSTNIRSKQPKQLAPIQSKPRNSLIHQRRRVEDGKENSDNSNSSSNNQELPRNKPDLAAVPPKKEVSSTTSQKKYFMDIDSLRREHADAIKMLEELDKNEGQRRRRSLDSSAESNASFASYNSVNNTLDDEFVQDCSSKSPYTDEVVVRRNNTNNDAPHTVTESFLDMTHLSISLRDEFDCGDDVDGNDNFFDQSDRVGSVGGGSINLTPTKNRSFTSSCASIEESSDFFGEECHSCSTEEYSSGGTF